MRAETARSAEIAEQPANREHASQCDKTDNADRDITLGNRQRVCLARFACARCGHRAGETLGDGFYQFEQGPNG